MAAKMNEYVKVKNVAGVTTITLSRASEGNPVSSEMIVAMTAAVNALPKECRILALRAEGPDFCVGRDYGAAPEDARAGKKPTALQIQDRMTQPIIDFYLGLHNVHVPTVSIVQGRAAGFGCALACAADIVMAADDAKFGLPEMHERGLPPSLAMTALFERVSLRMLTYLVFGAQPISAEAALAAGLVSAVVEKESLQNEGNRLISHICNLPPDSVQAVKTYLKLASQMNPQGRAALGSGLYSIVAGSR